MRRLRIITALLLSGYLTHGQVRLPKLVSDGMVLQRDAAVTLWGWAAPGENIHLEFDHQKLDAVTNQLGEWTIRLTPHAAGGPFEMKFSASNQLHLTNILFGDVWVCSGQSNMELTMDRVRDQYPAEITAPENTDIRQFLVPDVYDFEYERKDVESGQWLAANPENILRFSAVAYFFAKELQAKYHVPVGLINAALGGSPAEAWMSETALKKFPDHFEEAQKFKNKSHIDEIESMNKKINHAWSARLSSSDTGLKFNWSNGLDHVEADLLEIPSMLEMTGSVWFGRKIQVPKEMTLAPSRLLLGRLVDADSVFLNGVFVGTTGYQYPPRKYAIAPGILKTGDNDLVVRMIINAGKGGFVSDKPYFLVSGNDTIDLKGLWKYKVGATMEPILPQTTVRWKPEGLFNAMIAPLTRYCVKGIIWYQGESNTKNPGEYAALMKELIADWRGHWKEPELPFLFVQLANFMEPKKSPAESRWAELRQAQSETLAIPHTGMAVAIDLGEWNDIHPLNKADVGKRLALQAMKVGYKETKLVASGPLLKSVRKDRKQLVLTFESGGGLMSRGSMDLRCFEVAAADRKFVPANALIQDNKVLVWSGEVPQPHWVRYAWADNPEGANLYNKENLPASPFEAESK